MKIIKILAIVVISFFALLLIIPAFLPSNLVIESSLDINKPASQIFPHVADYSQWQPWSVWAAMDHKAKFSYTGEMQALGSRMTWKGDTIGEGYLELKKIEPNKLIESKLIFTKPNSRESKDEWIFEDLGNNKTKVTWKNTGELGYPLGRIYGLIAKNILEEKFKTGLINLKKLVEAEATPGNINIIQETVASKLMYYIEDGMDNMDPKLIGEKYAKNYSEIMTFVNKNKIQCIGAPFSINTFYNGKSWKFQAGFPVIKNDIKPTGRIKAGSTYAGKVLKAIHLGPYENLAPVYSTLEKFMKDNNMQANGFSWEEYINDPTTVSPDKIETHIYYPVK